MRQKTATSDEMSDTDSERHNVTRSVATRKLAIKKPGRDTSTVKGVGFDVSSKLKGVEETKKLKELERMLSEGNLEKKSQLVQEDQEDQYAFSKMKLNMSEPDFYNFIRGHYTMEERKRAKETWEAHSAMGHMSKKALGDAMENGVYAGSYLTRADVENAYKIYSGCNACMEAQYKLPSEPESKSPTAPWVAHTLNIDIFFYRNVTLGGNRLVIIATDQKSGAILHVREEKDGGRSGRGDLEDRRWIEQVLPQGDEHCVR